MEWNGTASDRAVCPHGCTHPVVHGHALDLDGAEEVHPPAAGSAALGLADALLAELLELGRQARAGHPARGREAPQLVLPLLQRAEMGKEAVLLVGRVEERL